MNREEERQDAGADDRSLILKRDASLFRFDAHNPRLVEELSGAGLSQQEAAQRLLDDHDPIAIARSMARFGFFETDPLIARDLDGELEVLEGNRRLLAVRLLTDPKLRSTLDADDEYEALADELGSRGHSFESLPVLVVDDRDDANAVIGFRHIVGIKRWPAYEKAAFVTRLLKQLASEGAQAPYDDVAVLTGEDPSDVRRYVRNYIALRQATDAGVDTGRARDNFGALTYAFSVRKIGQYIQLAAPAQLAVDADKAYAAEDERMNTLVALLFGDSENPAAVTDSRRYGDLGRVLEVPEALNKILQTHQLDDALALTDALRDRVLKELRRARTAVQTALTEHDDQKLIIDALVWAELEGLQSDLSTLLSEVGGPATGSSAADPLDEGPDIEEEDEFESDEGGADAYAL